MSTKTDIKDCAFRGSIRVESLPFQKATEPKWVEISLKGCKPALIKYASILTDEVKTIFTKAKINWIPVKGEGSGFINSIEGLVFDSIELADEGYARIKFSGITASDYQNKRNQIVEYCDKNNISHGEKDGSTSCVWFCPKKGRQSELIDDLMTKLDELRKE